MDAILRALTAGVKVKQQSIPISRSSVSQQHSLSVISRGTTLPAGASKPTEKVSHKRNREFDDTHSDEGDDDSNSSDEDGHREEEDDSEAEEDEDAHDMAVFSRASAGRTSTQASSSGSKAKSGKKGSGESDAARAARLEVEAQNALRNKLGIKVTGGTAPALWQTFDALPTSSAAGPVRDNLLPAIALERGVVGDAGKVGARHDWLRRQLLAIVEESEYKEPTGVQMQALPLCTAPVGREVVAIAPTGQGKTAAYTLPMLLRLQGGSRVGTEDGTWPGPRALILVPTKDLAGQVSREVRRLGADSAGLKAAVLSRATVGGAAGHAVSAAVLAPELLAGKKKKKGQGGRRGAKGGRDTRRKRDSDSDEAGSEQEDEHDDAGEVDDDDEEEGSGSEHEQEEEEEDDEAMHWTDDEELEAGGAGAGAGKGSSSKGAADNVAPPPVGAPGPSPTHWTAPSLSHCDILVSTPLLLLSALRSARQEMAKAAGVPLPSVGALFPRLAVCVLDECDRLLGGEDVRHRGSRTGEASGFAAQVDEILLAARPGKAALQRWWQGHGLKVQGKEGEQQQGQGKEKEGKSGAGKANRGQGKAAAVSAPSPAQHYATHVASSLNLHLFTATLPGHVREVLAHALRSPLMLQVGSAGAAAVNVDQRLLFVGREDGKLVALRDMLAKGVATPALVFVSSQERCEQVAQVLKLAGQSVAVLHGGVGEGQREQAITRFRRGEVAWLVATDVAARGLDYPAVRFVLSVDFPTSAASYVHRVGRTGRAGRQGEACTYFTEQDVPALRSVASVLRATGCEVPDWMLQLKKASGAEKAAWVRGQGHRRPILKGKGGKRGKGGRK